MCVCVFVCVCADDNCPLNGNNSMVGNLFSSSGNQIASSVIGIVLMFITVAYTRCACMCSIATCILLIV